MQVKYAEVLKLPIEEVFSGLLTWLSTSYIFIFEA